MSSLDSKNKKKRKKIFCVHCLGIVSRVIWNTLENQSHTLQEGMVQDF